VAGQLGDGLTAEGARRGLHAGRLSALGRPPRQGDEARPEELGRVESAPRQGVGRLAWDAQQEKCQDQ